MNDSMKNWIEFFRNKAIEDVNISTLEKIHASLSNYYTKSYILPNTIFQALNGNFEDFKKVVGALVDAKIISYLPSCPKCNNFLGYPTGHMSYGECNKCGEEFDYTEIEDSIELLIDGKGNSILLEASYELNALILSKQALQKGSIFYLLCDIEGSEHLQKQNTILYNSYLKQLWSNFFPSSLLECRKAYLPLMAKGDAAIISFLDILDSINFIKKISKSINKEPFKLTIYLDKLDYSPNDFAGFVRTLDNKWDFNSESVTLFHRRAHSVKPKAWANLENYSTKICILDNLLNDKDNLEIILNQKINSENYKFKSKHDELFQGNLLSLSL